MRDAGLGNLRLLNDRCLLYVLRELEAKDLMSLMLVSRSFYVYATHENLWKRLCIRRHRGRFKFRLFADFRYNGFQEIFTSKAAGGVLVYWIENAL